jgi:hypothetical protein
VADFVACLRQFCADTGLDAETTRFWVCACALNQHDWSGEMAGGLASGPFARALLLADCALSVLDANGVCFKRCVPPALCARSRARGVCVRVRRSARARACPRRRMRGRCV